jgi:hypothetical protein
MLKQYTIIKEIADFQLKLLDENGYIESGINGPYSCRDTEVRNTAHWIGIYKYIWIKSKDLRYLHAIKKLADYLCLDKHYGQSGAVKCIIDDKMDHLNGTIGQAWVIEGLVNAYESTKNSKYIDRAVDIFKSQKFNYKLHLWERIELDGKNLGIDYIFNHQLWFAASGSLILEYRNVKEISEQVNDFVLNLEKLFEVYKDGLIKHYVSGYKPPKKSLTKIIACKFFCFMKKFDPRFDIRSFEKAYHIFDLYGFALLHKRYNKSMIFCDLKLIKAIDYAQNIDKLNQEFNIEHFLVPKTNRLIKLNKYAYPYNSPAFEFPFVDYILNNNLNVNKYDKLWEFQVKATYHSQQKLFSYNTNDPKTLTARLYELTRYLEIKEQHEKK